MHVAIQTEHLTKNYGDVCAVKDLSLEVFRGEIFGFLGPNGAGKSTSIGMICGLIKPDSGNVRIHDQTGHSPVDTKSMIGFCPQEIILWPKLTCLEQLVFTGQMYGMSLRKARLSGKNLLARTGLFEKRNRLASTLSGGMKRRLNLCLALVHDPEIIVLDEPEAGLDPQSRVMVREFIREMGKAKTVILTTHNMDEADRLADRVAIIDQGRILRTDSPENLKQSIGAGNQLELGFRQQIPEELVSSLSHSFPSINQLTTFNPQLATRNSQPTTDNRQLTTDHPLLIIQTPDPMKLLPALLDHLAKTGFQPEEVRMRENTLEDVFIQLTGKKLRT